MFAQLCLARFQHSLSLSCQFTGLLLATEADLDLPRSSDWTNFQSLLKTYHQNTMAPFKPLTCSIDHFTGQI